MMNHYRQQFPIFAHTTYINSCSYGALANRVSQAMQQYLDDRQQHGECWPQWMRMMEQLRENTARLLGCHCGEIALTSSLSAGLNALVSGLEFADRPDKCKVICTDYDFPTSSQIWHAQKTRGAQIVMVELEQSPTPEQDICDRIDHHTAIVSIPYICYRHGRKLDVEKIIRQAHQHHALVILDAYQAAGSCVVDACKLNVDVLLGGYLKYLLGTSGLAFMYVRKNLLDTITPKTSGWFAQHDVHAMRINENQFAKTARKFESGTPDVSAIYACDAGLEIINEVGIGTIAKSIEQLTGLIKKAAHDHGWQLATGNHPHGPLLAIRSTDMHRLVERLREQAIVVSCRDNNIRISPHFYNNTEDIDKLLVGLNKHSALLA